MNFQTPSTIYKTLPCGHLMTTGGQLEEKTNQNRDCIIQPCFPMPQQRDRHMEQWVINGYLLIYLPILLMQQIFEMP